MNSSAFFTVFPRQFRFWTFHCFVNALPSFYIAWSLLGLNDSPSGMAAMLAGIGTFILLYAAITSLPGPLADRGNMLARSLVAGTKIRSWFVGISVLLAIFKVPLLFMDIYSGVLAVGAVEGPSQVFTAGRAIASIGSHSGFLRIYTVTIIDGIGLSVILLTISFVSLMVLQGKERRKAFRRGYPKAIPR